MSAQEQLWSGPENTDDLGQDTFDVIISGTGFVQSTLAGALSRSGLRVLHFDVNDFYGGDGATLTLAQFRRWLTSTGAEVINNSPEGFLESFRPSQWNIDLAPRGCLSGGLLVERLIDSQVGRYLEFKNVDQCLVYHGGDWLPLPGGRAAVFRSKQLQMMEKRRLMQLMQVVQHGQEDEKEVEGGEGKPCHAAADGVPEEWVSKPFHEYLGSHLKMSAKLRGVVFNALCGKSGTSDDSFSAGEGVARLRRVVSGIGQYGPTPFLYPSYGSSELSQAFCRVCALYRGVYVLRRGLQQVSVDSTGRVTGARCTAGAKFRCKHVVLPFSKGSGLPAAQSSHTGAVGETRAVVFADRPLFENKCGGDANPDETATEHVPSSPPLCLATLPPGCFAPEHPPSTVQVWQLGHGTVSSPSAVATLHFSMAAAGEGGAAALKKVVQHFVDLDARPSYEAEDSAAEPAAAQPEAGEAQPPIKAHFAAFFSLPDGGPASGPAVEVECDSPGAHVGEGAVLCSGPSGGVDVDEALAEAERLFRKVMEREKAVRAESGCDEADAEVPFEPDRFLGRLPDPESNLPPVVDDYESRLLGVADLRPADKQAEDFEQPRLPEHFDPAVGEEGEAGGDGFLQPDDLE